MTRFIPKLLIHTSRYRYSKIENRIRSISLELDFRVLTCVICESFKEFTQWLNLQPGKKVLDIGCGTGGSAFYMAEKHGVQVLGIDLSTNMLAIANEHRATMNSEVQNLVTFRYLDATLAVFPQGSFDVIYSRDAIMHIFDKELLYGKILVMSYVLPRVSMFNFAFLGLA